MSKLFRPDTKPHSILIEQTCLQFAATWYEAGRSTGLTSKFKDARSYAKANWPKFIPKVVDIFLDMLNKPSTPAGMKEEIHAALMERHNDPTLTEGRPSIPDIDVKKVLAATRQPTIIIDTLMDNIKKKKPNVTI